MIEIRLSLRIPDRSVPASSGIDIREVKIE